MEGREQGEGGRRDGEKEVEKEGGREKRNLTFSQLEESSTTQ